MLTARFANLLPRSAIVSSCHPCQSTKAWFIARRDLVNADVPPEEKRAIYRLIYSYVVRRAVCDLTSKNMNKNFIRLVSIFNDKGVSVEVLKGAFASQTGPAVRFPDDKEFSEAILVKPIYRNIQRAERIVDILWELESAMRSKFQINERRPDFLSVEHILPQSWHDHWPLADGRSVAATGYPYDDAMNAGLTLRGEYLHRLGNLTLVTAPLNSSMQNQGYDKKRERLAVTKISGYTDESSQVASFRPSHAISGSPSPVSKASYIGLNFSKAPSSSPTVSNLGFPLGRANAR